MKYTVTIILLLVTGCSRPGLPQNTVPSSAKNECPKEEGPTNFGATQAIAGAEYALRLQDQFDERNRPFSAELRGKLWIVTGTIAPSGAPEVHLDQDSARVVTIFYRFMQGEQSAPEESVPDKKTARALARIYMPDVQGELHAVLMPSG